MERYSVSTTTQGQARAARGQLVESGSCEARNRGRALQTMQKNTKKTQPSERVAALLTGSRTIALHWNKDGVSWGQGKRLHPEGSGEERLALPPWPRPRPQPLPRALQAPRQRLARPGQS